MDFIELRGRSPFCTLERGWLKSTNKASRFRQLWVAIPKCWENPGYVALKLGHCRSNLHIFLPSSILSQPPRPGALLFFFRGPAVARIHPCSVPQIGGPFLHNGSVFTGRPRRPRRPRRRPRRTMPASRHRPVEQPSGPRRPTPSAGDRAGRPKPGAVHRDA